MKGGKACLPFSAQSCRNCLILRSWSSIESQSVMTWVELHSHLLEMSLVVLVRSLWTMLEVLLMATTMAEQIL